MPKLTEDEQRAIIASRLSDTIGSTDSELRNDRKKALDFYYGRPLGNEIDGRSQVVSKDVMDTIEWMMPSFMRIFCNQQAVQFDPVGPEDEVQAKQETGYVNHVLWKKNPGFMIVYEWAKDGLMQKNGYVKYWWQEEKKTCFESYTGLTPEQLITVMQSLEKRGEVEVVGQDIDDYGTYSIKVKVTSSYGCAKIECVPSEEVIVDRNCRGDIKKSRTVGHLRKNVTRSELIEQGYDKAKVKNLTSYVWDNDLSEKLARDSVSESLNDGEHKDGDAASDELQLLEVLTYIDADDDGIAELRRYLLAGNETLENEEADEINWESWTPIPIPHRHSGLSIYDIMEDLQRIKTALQRGLLDNVYFTNNPRNVYDKNTIDVRSLQINRPGGHVANDGQVIGCIMPLPVQPMAGNILPVIDYVDTVKETRTGTGRVTQGVDADVLAQSTKGAYLDARGAANQRIEAIARIFAETGLSSLVRSLHGLLQRHQDWPEKFKLRNDWVQTNPADWQQRTDLTVSVGLGNASKEEIRSNIQIMGMAQEKAGMVPGLIQPDNVYALFKRFQTELGFENENFITDPNSEQYKQFLQSQQGGEDPFVTGEKIKSQTALEKQRMIEEGDDKDRAADTEIELAKLHQKAHSDEAGRHNDMAKAGVSAHVALARGSQSARGNGSAASGKPAT